MTAIDRLKHNFINKFELTDTDWLAFEQVGKISQFNAGQTLFQAGDILTEIKFVLSGTACNYYLKPDGTRRNKSFLQTGDVAASLSSVYNNQPCRFSCEALKTLVCFTVSYTDFYRISRLSDKWRDILEQMVIGLALKKEAREADLLMLSATELYQQFVAQMPELADSLPNYHIASYLGISEVSLSRIRAKLGIQHSYKK